MRRIWKRALLMIASALALSSFTPAPTRAEEALRTALVLVPHEDDETLAFAGSIKNHLDSGDRVIIGILTNGDYEGGRAMGEKRIGESFRAMTQLGVPAEDIYFFGYGDTGWRRRGLINPSFLAKLFYSEQEDRVYRSKVGRETYGNTSLGIQTLHRRFFGSEALYTKRNLLLDMAALLERTRPDFIYTTASADFHWDHKTAESICDAAIRGRRAEDPSYHPVLRSSIIHAVDAQGRQDNAWPLAYTDDEALLPFTVPGDLAGQSGLVWEERSVVQLPEDMLIRPRTANLKRQLIQIYESQLSCIYMENFVRSDEFYWEQSY